jgi:hypothetical protein
MYGEQRSPGVTWLWPIVVLAVVLACGWYVFMRPSGSAGHNVSIPGPLDVPSKASPMLLRPNQLGDEFSQSADGSRPTTRRELVRGAPPAAVAAVHSGWVAGARAQFYQPNATIQVWSGAELFTTDGQSAAYEPELVSRLEQQFRGTAQAAPSRSPGEGARLVIGRWTDPRYSTTYDSRRRVTAVVWRHGAVLAYVVVAARTVDGPGPLAAKLAGEQDQNITFALR